MVGCDVCDVNDLSRCLDCTEGYYEISWGVCALCNDKCLTCTSGTVCKSCRHGYKLIDNVCYENC